MGQYNRASGAKVFDLKNVVAIFLKNRKRRALFFAMALVAAVGPTLCLILMSIVIGGLVDGVVLYGPLFLFLVTACVSAGALYVTVRQCGVIVETDISARRLAIEEAISKVDLEQLRRIGTARIEEVLSTDFAKVSAMSRRLPNVATSASSLVLSALVILLFAPWILLVFVVLFAIGAGAYLVGQRRLADLMKRTRAAKGEHIKLLRHLLSGQKEVRLHENRRSTLIEGFLGPTSMTLRKAAIDENAVHASLLCIVNVFAWVSLFVIVAALPLYVDDTAVVVQALYVAIFVRNYLFALVLELPGVIDLSSSLSEIVLLDHDLQNALHDLPSADGEPLEFRRISVEDLTFSYHEGDRSEGFYLGPVSLSIERGQTVFLVGENGAGKSTFLKLLARLYSPLDGQIRVDDAVLDERDVARYRSLFSCVFTDFHLFDRLYGLEHVTDQQANDMLRDLGIADRVDVVDGAFSTTDLSSGQRQRLALAVALLENRPILILDEIAADQDPNFRRRIYRELIPAWRAAGRTLVVVSHDDRFFDLADTLVTFAGGNVTVEHRGRGDGG